MTSFLVISVSKILKDSYLFKLGVLSIFAIFGCGVHLRVNCDEMAGARLRQFAKGTAIGFRASREH